MYWQPLFFVLWATSVQAVALDQRDEGVQQPIIANPTGTHTSPKTSVLSAAADFPTVDLGYVKHKAVANPNTALYKFQNIRYAAAPTGSLRFKAPQPPVENKNGVEDGAGRKECLQAKVNWADNFPDDTGPCIDCECCQQEGADGNCTTTCSDKQRSAPSSNKAVLGAFMPDLTDPKLYSEDCLFLDVWVPKDVFDKKDNNDEYPYPVLVWIYGGAFIFGGKSLYFPGGLFDRAKLLEDNFIFVAMNYRMGALGFAAGQDIKDEDVNAGLLDQQQALKWVQKYIGKFGGDPASVTIAGLSAGGGSVIHHVTAQGGEGDELFQRAISLSGGWQPITNKTRANATFNDFMGLAGAKNLDDLRQVSEEKIRQANYDHIAKAPPGTFLFNPTAWGTFAPKSPPKLLSDSNFHRSVDMILSHVSDEGGKFTGAFMEKNTSVAEFLDLALPDLDSDEREFVIETYDTPEIDAVDIGRIIADSIFRCHVTYVSDAKYKNVYRQRWDTFKSGGHGGDLLSLFYQPGILVQSVRSAHILQDYVVTFALFGSPFTIVENPPGAAQPVSYAKTISDNKVQWLGSGALKLPVVTRGPIEADYICRVWQIIEST